MALTKGSFVAKLELEKRMVRVVPREYSARVIVCVQGARMSQCSHGGD